MLNSLLGGEILEPLTDQNITEIMVNPDGKLWLDGLDHGKLFSGTRLSAERIRSIIKLVAAINNLHVNESSPELSATLPRNEARFQGWIEPVVNSPCFNIRALAKRIFTIDDYLQRSALTAEQAEQLRHAIIERRNIIVAGGSGSGKTTFTNALLHELRSSKERIILIQDLNELALSTPDCVALNTSANKTIRDLVRGSLRMRPDRLIIGEVRDGSALEMLKAWNTGHPGGICTIHANSVEAVIARLEDLILEVMPTIPIRLIEEAIDLIVFMDRGKSNDHYRVAKVAEIASEISSSQNHSIHQR